MMVRMPDRRDGSANEPGLVTSNILQDINTYMRMNGGQTGELRKSTLRLGDKHEVSIVVGTDHIKAVVRERRDQVQALEGTDDSE